MLSSLLWRYLGPRRHLVAVAFLMQIIQTVATLLLPALNAQLIDRGVVPGDQGRIFITGAVMLALVFVQGGSGVAGVWISARIATDIAENSRNAIMSRVARVPTIAVTGIGVPSLITRTINDVRHIQIFVTTNLGHVTTAPLMGVGALALAVTQDPPLATVLTGLVFVVAVCMVIALIRMSPLYRDVQAQNDRLNLLVRERISGVRVVRAFRRDAHESARFSRTNSELRILSLRVNTLLLSMFPLMLFLANGFSVGVIWVGAYRVQSGAVGIGSLTAFLGYLGLVLMSVILIILAILELPRARVSARRITEVTSAAPSLAPATSPDQIAVGFTGVEVLRLGFRYEGAEKPILDEITFSLEPGRTLGVVGGTGSGKTTLLHLVLRLAEPATGSVRVNGIDIRSWDHAELCRVLGLVPQQTVLFRGTIASNLRFGKPDAADDELWRVLDIAQAREFVEHLPGGLEAAVATGGANFSGGQRQRLAIARTLVRRPDVYLFDDCFSALDSVTGAAVRRALAVEARASAVLITTQVPHHVSDADHILFLDHGRVVAQGSHHSLLRDNPAYRALASSAQVFNAASGS